MPLLSPRSTHWIIHLLLHAGYAIHKGLMITELSISADLPCDVGVGKKGLVLDTYLRWISSQGCGCCGPERHHPVPSRCTPYMTMCLTSSVLSRSDDMIRLATDGRMYILEGCTFFVACIASRMVFLWSKDSVTAKQSARRLPQSYEHGVSNTIGPTKTRREVYEQYVLLCERIKDFICYPWLMQTPSAQHPSSNNQCFLP